VALFEAIFWGIFLKGPRKAIKNVSVSVADVPAEIESSQKSDALLIEPTCLVSRFRYATVSEAVDISAQSLRWTWICVCGLWKFNCRTTEF
jgi:hypothetical protein